MKLKINLKSALKVITISFCLALVCALTLTSKAKAQIDGGLFNLLQNGAKVGEIYVPQHEPGAINYVEHWVLFNNYEYPGKDPSLVTTIVAGRNGYESEQDFFKRVPWGSGSRYVRVDSTDTDKLPGR